MQKFIIVLFLITCIMSCANVSLSQVKFGAVSQNEYTCADACNNYHKHSCHSQIDTCGFSCVDVCNFFRATIVNQSVLYCLSTEKTCKTIFKCVGY